MACQYLGILATSTSIKRIFSKSSLFIIKSRTKLKLKIIEKAILLNNQKELINPKKSRNTIRNTINYISSNSSNSNLNSNLKNN